MYPEKGRMNMQGGSDVLLYHGSYCEVAVPDLSKCAQYKDFGQGFYLTTSRQQAESFSRTSRRRAVFRGDLPESQQYGVISIFSCEADVCSRLQCCFFQTADISWLHCITGHRKPAGFPGVVEQYQAYDILGGKIANDATNATITAYMAGVYGTVGSSRAAEFCISLLLPDRLQDQFCFRTQAALDSLHFVESVRVWK